MKAMVLEQYDRVPTVQELEPLPLAPHDVRVETGASGVCHSDLSVLHGQYTYLTLPLVMGHEGAGRVTEVGAAVTSLKPGDRVIASWRSACGFCFQCVRARQHLCEQSRPLSLLPRARRGGETLNAYMGLGTLAEQMTINELNLVRVQTDLPDEQLALLGCGVTTGVGSALWTAQVEPGTTAVVFGCGGVGLSAIQGCRIAGAARIIAVDPTASKREAALALGASDTIDPAAGDPVEQVLALTGGYGADYTFEAVGLVETMEQAFSAACRGGTVVFVGALAADIGLTLPANALHADGKRILGSSYGSAQVRRDLPRLVALIEAGRLDVGSMISEITSLDVGATAAFEAIEAGRGIRTVIVP
jgi:S-(hydroxymethyl)glutathione dehydrogenase/alcohol dehydrogenase